MVEKIKKTFNLLIIIILFLVYSTASNAKPLVFGNEKAKVTVRVFSSLTCPHCADLHEELFYNLKKDFIDSKKVKFIHSGTDEIYGDLPLKSTSYKNEKSKLIPNNPYSSSKAAGVLAVETWIRNFNFPAIICNSVNNFGPYQFVEKFIPRSIQSCTSLIGCKPQTFILILI